ncbi:Yqey-like protein-domain-containing protein [Gilbertella persicaria]|uniref:Altered inheritance of mitochondria protein 41 n=1 Tax=Rhizopus stolonifer TaxID=4846 RepID=A0A367KQE4_RHIST|nr:Yqey-like protein-domain-containing protein [Gilbertella persicaria]KAI8059929.1 Yqey-like protein-domain-containing protein [Gilbertella persicaria]RCI04350.1 hypothetical protein CU098_009310 [Rhizopus stolonifer]
MSFLARLSGSVRRPVVYTATRYYTAGAVAPQSLVSRLKEDRKTLMKAKKQPDLNVVKGLLSDLSYHTKSTEFVQGSSEEDAAKVVLQRAIKRRQDSIHQYEAGNRPELASQEKEELVILQSYMPDQMTPEEIEQELKEIIGEVGATTSRDMGKVMKVWKRDPLTADRKTVTDILKKLLN